MPQRSRLAPFPIIEDLSESRLAGGWLKMQLALLHASDEERSQKSMTFQEYKRQIASKPSEGNMKADHFVAQDFEEQGQSQDGFRSMKAGFGSSTPTGRDPSRLSGHSKSSAFSKSAPRPSRFSEKSDYRRTDGIEDLPWECWGGMTTRQIRNSPLFKQFANEHPAIFNDLFTPTEPVDPELLDPSKGFTPKMIKYGLGIPGVAKCKKQGKTDERYKSAYETTEKLRKSGRIEAFREATALKHRKESIPRSWRGSLVSEDNVPANNTANRSFRLLRDSETPRRSIQSLGEKLDGVDDEIRFGSFDQKLDDCIDYSHQDFLKGSANRYSLQLALDMTDWEQTNYAADDDQDDPLGEESLNDNYGSCLSFDDSALCSRAEAMDSFDDQGQIQVEKQTSANFRKSALKNSRDATEEGKSTPRGELRARFAVTSSPSSSSNIPLLE